MSITIDVHQGIVRPSLLAELESFHAPDQRVSRYYLDLDPRRSGSPKAVREVLEKTLARERGQIAQLDLGHAVRQALLRDLEEVERLAPLVIGERHTRSLACFVASERRSGRVLPLPWPTRHCAFFEDRFVLWPLQQILDQSDRYAIVLTDKDDARLFLFFQERIEEVTTLKDEIPGRVRYPGRSREIEYAQAHRVLDTCPLRVTTPSLAETPMWAASTLGSHFSSSRTSRCNSLSVFMSGSSAALDRSSPEVGPAGSDRTHRTVVRLPFATGMPDRLRGQEM